VLVVAPLVILTMCGLAVAQTPNPTSSEYARAVYNVIQTQWAPRVAINDLAQGASCTARIVQLPGGEVLNVAFLPDCEFTTAGKQMVNEAIQASSPLPYSGFEAVFQREIRMTFHAPTAEDRRTVEAQRAANQRVADASAASDARWARDAEARARKDRYALACSDHISSVMPKDVLKQTVMIQVAIDPSGRVVDVPYVGIASEEGVVRRATTADRSLIAALKSIPACAPFPAGLDAGAGKVDIGPIVLRAAGA